MLTYKQKLSILKSVGAAKEMKGRGIYSFGLGTSNKKMYFIGHTWEEAVKFCDGFNWFLKYEKR